MFFFPKTFSCQPKDFWTGSGRTNSILNETNLLEIDNWLYFVRYLQTSTGLVYNELIT